ncbi:Pif-8 [Phenacoccus solenopsis nudivirus]|nr:Pif-8 [Phenacoccus solenopsis nudivirus]
MKTTDWLYFFVIIICGIIIFMVYYAQLLKPLTRLEDLYALLLVTEPQTVAFTFGWIDSRKSFKNVYAKINVKTNNLNDSSPNTDVATISNASSPQLTFDVRYENFPVDKFGLPIRLNDRHGEIVESLNGFMIRGVNNNETFSCPSNEFHTSACVLRPLCESSDAGKYKRVNYAQFQYLNLYNYRGSAANKSRHDAPPTMSIHPKLFVKCIDDKNNYVVENCESNTMMRSLETKPSNKKYACVPYDICSEKLTGITHNQKIAEYGKPLTDEQYYICEQGRSKLVNCAKNTVYSASNGACINKCLGQGNKRFRINLTSYLQCSNDAGTVIQCPNGIVEDEKYTVACLVNNNCVEEHQNYEDKYVKYTYEAIQCVNNEPVLIECSSIDSRRRIETVYETDNSLLSTPFTYDQWPKQYYMNGKCVENNTPIDKNNDDIEKRDAIVSNFKIMAFVDPIDFSPYEKRCLCDSATTNVYIDYIRDVIMFNGTPSDTLYKRNLLPNSDSVVCFNIDTDTTALDKHPLYSMCLDELTYNPDENNIQVDPSSYPKASVYLLQTPKIKTPMTEEFAHLSALYHTYLGLVVMVDVNSKRLDTSQYDFTTYGLLTVPQILTSSKAKSRTNTEKYAIPYITTWDNESYQLVVYKVNELPDYYSESEDGKSVVYANNPHIIYPTFSETDTRIRIPWYVFDDIKVVEKPPTPPPADPPPPNEPPVDPPPNEPPSDPSSRIRRSLKRLVTTTKQSLSSNRHQQNR